jgi:hypothetical protein
MAHAHNEVNILFIYQRCKCSNSYNRLFYPKISSPAGRTRSSAGWMSGLEYNNLVREISYTKISGILRSVYLSDGRPSCSNATVMSVTANRDIVL